MKQSLKCEDSHAKTANMSRHLLSRTLLAFLPLLALSFRASQADTIQTFVLSGQYAFAHSSTTGLLDGTVTVDTSTGAVLSIDFDYVGRDATDVRLNGGDEVEYFSGLTEIGDAYGGFNGLPYFAETIVLPVSNLIGYSGGQVCSQANPCAASSIVTSRTQSGYLVSGNLGLAPEPSTLVYLGSGLLPLAALARKRVPLR